MDYKRFGNKIVLRLKKGDKVRESIREVAVKENIKAGYFTGIGAVDTLKIGLFYPEKGDYTWDYYNEDMEVTSIVGNIGMVDGDQLVHTHITCGRAKSEIIGGHLDEATCSLTMEIFIDVIDGEIVKRLDPDLGINTIEFE